MSELPRPSQGCWLAHLLTDTTLRVRQGTATTSQPKHAVGADIIPFPQSPVFILDSTFKGNFHTVEREITQPQTGERIIQRITVGKLNERDAKSYGVLTRIHYEAFYKLLKLWQAHDFPLSDESAHLTVDSFELSTYLWGSDDPEHYQQTRRIIYELNATPIDCINLYTAKSLRAHRPFELLGGVSAVERHVYRKTRRPAPGGFCRRSFRFPKPIVKRFFNQPIARISVLDPVPTPEP